MPTVQFQEENEVLGLITPLAANVAVGIHAAEPVCITDFHGIFILLIVGDSEGAGTLDVTPYQGKGAAMEDALELEDYVLDTIDFTHAEGGVAGIYIPTTAFNSRMGYTHLEVEVEVNAAAYNYTLVVFGHKPRYLGADTSNFIELVTRDV